jgi:hypothetical protein
MQKMDEFVDKQSKPDAKTNSSVFLRNKYRHQHQDYARVHVVPIISFLIKKKIVIPEQK